MIVKMVTILPSDSRVDGLTLGEWTAQWWQWVYSISEVDNPVADTKGTKSGNGQAGDLYFLAGSFGNPENARITRHSAIPGQKYVLIPIGNSIFSTLELNDPNITDRELFVLASTDIEKATVLSVKIDNVVSLGTATIKQNYRLVSPSFQVQLPNNAVQRLPAGTTRAAADGFYICLAPNSFDTGSKHTIDIDATIGTFDTHVTYKLNVT